MNNRLNTLSESLLGKKQLSDFALTDIRQLVHQYPWLAAARVLLVKKLEQEKDPEWERELNKASSYFQDQTWLQFLLQDEPIHVSIPNTELSFEPFHTVDYFASQGIRIRLEDLPQDKFGQQLKSFTDWIRVMKKLPLSEVGKSVDPKAERKVEQLAGQSLEQQEVVTEAMAEIWIKQKNMAKAKEVYHKLSLLEPSKSAYFASKIKELN